MSPSTIAAPAAGGSAAVNITATGACLFDAKTSAGWIVITRTAQGLTLQLAPNPTTVPRTATIDVGGYIVTVTQPAPEVTNLLANGTFDVDTAGWTNVFSTGSGAARWSSDPVNTRITPGGGVADIRSTQPQYGYQLHQCVAIKTNTRYDFGAQVFVPSGQDAAGEAALGAYLFSTADCTGGYYDSVPVQYSSPRDVWTSLARSFTTDGRARSVIVVISVGGANAPSFHAYFDDVYLREKR